MSILDEIREKTSGRSAASGSSQERSAETSADNSGGGILGWIRERTGGGSTQRQTGPRVVGNDYSGRYVTGLDFGTLSGLAGQNSETGGARKDWFSDYTARLAAMGLGVGAVDTTLRKKDEDEEDEWSWEESSLPGDGTSRTPSPTGEDIEGVTAGGTQTAAPVLPGFYRPAEEGWGGMPGPFGTDTGRGGLDYILQGIEDFGSKEAWEAYQDYSLDMANARVGGMSMEEWAEQNAAAADAAWERQQAAEKALEDSRADKIATVWEQGLNAEEKAIADTLTDLFWDDTELTDEEGRLTEHGWEKAQEFGLITAEQWQEYQAAQENRDAAAAPVREEAEAAQEDYTRAYLYEQFSGAQRYSDLYVRATDPEDTEFAAAATAGMNAYSQDLMDRQEKVEGWMEESWSEAANREDASSFYERNRLDYDENGPTEEWTQEQQEIFGYLYGQEGEDAKEKAFAFARSVNNSIAHQKKNAELQEYQDWGNTSAWGGAAGSIASVLGMPIAGVYFLLDAAEYAEKGYVTERDYANGFEAANAIAGGSAEALNDLGTIRFFGKDRGLGDLYQIGNSTLQSLGWGHVLGAAMTAIMMGGGAAESGYDEALARTGDYGQALLYAAFCWAAETGSEYLPLDHLLKTGAPKNIGEFLKNTGIQGMFEGAEGLFSSFMGFAADEWVNGRQSEYNHKVTEYSVTMSPEQAEQQASKETMEDMAWDFVSEAVGGIFGAGGQQAVQGVSTVDSETAETLFNEAAMLPEDSAAYQMAQGYQNSGKALRGFGAAKLDAAITEADQETMNAAVEERLTELGEGENAGNLARLITNAAQEMWNRIREAASDRAADKAVEDFKSGKLLGPDGQRILGESKYGRRVLEEMSPDNILNETHSSAWAENMGTVRLGDGLYAGESRMVTDAGTGTADNAAAGETEDTASEDVTAADKNESVTLEEGQAGSIGVMRADGSVEVHTETGTQVLDAEDERLPEAVRKLGNTLRERLGESAPLAFTAYESGQNIEAYAAAWEQAEKLYGKRTSLTVEQIMERSPILLESLTEDQLRLAVEQGRSAVNSEFGVRNSELESGRAVEGTGPYTGVIETGAVMTGTGAVEMENAASVEAAGAAAAGTSTVTAATGTRGPRVKGTVSYDGAVMNGVRYDAVDQSKLTRRQKKQIKAVTMLAEISGVNVHFYQSRKDSKGRFQGANGGYRSGEGIFLDVNAGAYSSRSLSQVAIIRTAAHELTHFIQDQGAAQYRELTDFLLTHLSEYQGKSLGELVQAKLDRDTTGKLSYDAAIDEVVCDGCEMMLRRTTVAETLAQEKPGLFNSIRRWLRRWAARIADAFEGVEAFHDEAKAMEGYLDELQDIWDRAFVAAARNGANAESGVRNAEAENERAAEGVGPYEGDETQLEERDFSYAELVSKKPIRGEVITAAMGNELPLQQDGSLDIKKLQQKVRENCQVTYNPKGGANYYLRVDDLNTNVEIVNDSLSHGFIKASDGRISPRDRRNSLAALNLSTIIGNSIEVNRLGQRGNLDVPYSHVMLGVMGIVEDGATNYYAVRFVVEERINRPPVLVKAEVTGKVHAINAKKIGKPHAQVAKGVALTTRSLFDYSVAELLDDVKNDFRDTFSEDVYRHLGMQRRNNAYFSPLLFQERDAAPTDRELLMEAAETPRAGLDVQEYARKVRSMERAQEKLERRRAALEALERGNSEFGIQNSELENGLAAETGERAAEGVGPYTEEAKAQAEKLRGEIEKLEAQIERAEKALKKAEQTPALKRAAERALAAWREANPEQAARNMRALREENKALQEYVEYYRREARRTEPGQATLLPEDVRRMAKALLKQTDSQADAAEIARQLQALGDFMVQHQQGGGTGFFNELRRQAVALARHILENSWYTEDERAELRRDLREYLRNHRIGTEQFGSDIPDFADFRKRNFGTLVFSRDGMSMDQLYQDLRGSFGEALFPEDAMAPSDQLYEVLGVLQSLEPQDFRMFEGYRLRDASEELGNEIIDRLLSGEVGVKETMADRNYQRAMERLEQKYAAKDRARQQKLNDAEDQMKWERARRDDLQERLREEKRLRNQLAREKAYELRQRSIQREQEYRARVRVAKARERLAKILQENSSKKHVPEVWKQALSEFLLSIDALSPRAQEKYRNQYIQQMQELQNILAKAALAQERGELPASGVQLDLLPFMDEMIQPFVERARKGEAWSIYQMDLEQLQSLEEILTAFSEAIRKADTLLADENGRSVAEAASGSIRDLEKVQGRSSTRGDKLRRVLAWDNATPFYAFKRFGSGGQQIFRELRRGWGKMAMNMQQVIEYAEKAYSSQEVQAWEKEVHSFELRRRLQNIAEEEQESGESRETETVTVTTAQLMGLYCLMKREQARGHLLGAGIRVANYRQGRSEVVQSENYLLDLETVAEMVDSLTERQKEVADALQKYMNTQGSDWGNEISMARWGIRSFTEENYYPIKTDSRNRDARSPDADRANLYRLVTMGFTKNTVRNANNAIVLDSIFDTFANHMADMAKYNALGLPLVDAMRWYNYRDISESSEDGQYTTESVQKTLERVYGKEAGSYFITFLQDLNGNNEGGRGEETLKDLMSRAKVAAISFNLRVALQQPTSIMRASMVIDAQYLARGAAMKGGREKALKYSGLAVWKDLGYFDTNINPGIRRQIKHDVDRRSWLTDKGTKLAEWGDQATWGALWNACEIEQREKTKLRGEELMRATAERFDEVILSTQVMDGTISRSQNMRSKSMMMAEFTAFKAEPTLTYNMLLDVASEASLAKRSGDRNALRAAGRKAVKAAAVYTATAAATAMFAAIADAFRDDDDYKSFLQKWWEAARKNFGDNLDPTQLVPVIGDVVNMLRGEDKDLMVLGSVKKVYEVFRIWKETAQLANGSLEKATEATWYGNMTLWGKIFKTMQMLDQFAGIGIAPAAREVTSLYNTLIAPATGWQKAKTYDAGEERELQYAFADGFLDEEQTKKLLLERGIAHTEAEASRTIFEWRNGGAYKELKEAALANDEAAYREAMQALTAAGYTEKNARSQVRGAIKDQYQGNGKSGAKLSKEQAAGMLEKYCAMDKDEARATVQEWTCYVVTGIAFDKIKTEVNEGGIDRKRATELLVTYGGLDRETAGNKVDYWEFLYDNEEYAEAFPQMSSYVKYRDETAPAGIDVKTWYSCYMGTKDLKADVDENGKTVDGSKREKVLAFIDSMPLSNAQKDALYYAKGYAQSTIGKAPWHTS